MTKTINNENNIRRSLPPCDQLHPVTVKFFDCGTCETWTFYDSEELALWCYNLPDYKIIETGHN